MASIEVQPAKWRLVEVGRVALFTSGEYAGRLAAIVEIIDHKRVLVEGTAENVKFAVPRHAAPLAHVSLTPIVISNLPRAAGHGPLAKKWKDAGVEKQWSETTYAKKKEQKAKRANLTDFERFKVMKLRKQARNEIRRAVATVKKAAA